MFFLFSKDVHRLAWNPSVLITSNGNLQQNLPSLGVYWMIMASSPAARDGNRKRDISLTIYFLCQCHMVWPRPFRRLEVVLSPFILMEEMNMITDYDQFLSPSSPNYVYIGPIFHKTHIFWTFGHKNVILMRFRNRCFPPCFTTDINWHLNGLIGETMN